MRYIKFLFSLSALFFFAACDKHHEDGETTELTITFKALYNGQPLEKNKLYDYSTYKVEFSQFNTYLSDIKLLKGTAETLVSEIEWVNFTPDFATDNKAVDVTIKATVPSDHYTGIKMGYGVKPSLNAKRPSDFAAGHPLNKEVEFWPGWKSYIFNKIEGQGDSDNDGTPDIFMLFHCGSDKVYREYSFEQEIHVHDATSSLTVEFDLKNLFYTNNTWWDMAAPGNNATSNASTDVRVATELMDNFDKATAIK